MRFKMLQGDFQKIKKFWIFENFWKYFFLIGSPLWNHIYRAGPVMPGRPGTGPARARRCSARPGGHPVEMGGRFWIWRDKKLGCVKKLALQDGATSFSVFLRAFGALGVLNRFYRFSDHNSRFWPLSRFKNLNSDLKFGISEEFWSRMYKLVFFLAPKIKNWRIRIFRIFSGYPEISSFFKNKPFEKSSL